MPSPELQTEVRIVAEITARPGQAVALRAQLLKMIAPSNAEPGCRQYELHEDRENPDRFVFIERWTDQAAFDFHTQTPHFIQLGPAIADLLQSPAKLTKLKLIG
jgi:quinol monooxygenase YgiN